MKNIYVFTYQLFILQLRFPIAVFRTLFGSIFAPKATIRQKMQKKRGSLKAASALKKLFYFRIVIFLTIF